MSAAASDRNLLFGILALQVNFITRDALIKGMNAWVLEKHRTLADILAEQGALKAENRALLEPLVEQHLKEHGGDPQQSLVAISSVGSVRDDLQQIADPELCASLAHVSAVRQEEDAPATRPPAEGQNDEAEVPATRPPSVGTPTSSGLRFRILRPHARGGLGEVFVARDEELHREVALKEIQGRHADHPESRTRFVLEAEITGGLEHPGIVPVYGLGHYADGRPFYAMRFIRGDSLQQAIEAFHKADVPGRAPGERALSLRQLLGRFVDVCNAIAYAHSRGVLHRDLKPGNIMLGQYGETLVVDWGLAKAGGGTDPVTVSAEGVLRPTSASGSPPTQMGSAIGTPSFMSPEQATGRLDLLGSASDVYSLGATLYCMLTGKVPFEAKDAAALLQRVQKSDFLHPRQVKRNVPAALEAVCLKAMALRPQDRYDSPRTLADDVEHWLADEPVSAWREPLMMRTGRWVRRHRVLATSTAVAVLVALVLGTGGLVWRHQQEERERLAKINRQERAGERASSLLAQIMPLRKRMRWAEAQLLLLYAKDAVWEAEDTRLEEELRQTETDLALAQDLDRVREEGSAILDGKFTPSRVKERYPQVFKRYGMDLLERDPKSLADQMRASAVRDEILAALDDWTRFESEEKRQRHLLELAWRIDHANRWRRQLLAPGVLLDSTRLRRLLGQVNKDRVSPSTSIYVATLLGLRTPEALALLEGARERNPDDFWLNFWLAKSTAGEDYARGDRVRQEEAIGYYRAALAAKRESAAAHTNLGVVLAEKGDLDGAIRSYQEAARLDPTLALAYYNLGNALRQKGDRAGAIHHFYEAIRLDPTDARSHTNLGILLDVKGDLEGAIGRYREAIRLDPNQAQAYSNLGIALRVRGDLDEAISSFWNAIRLDPKLPQPHVNLGLALRARWDLQGAIHSLQKALLLEPKVSQSRHDPNWANVHAALGECLIVYGDFAHARASLRQASQRVPRTHPLSLFIEDQLAQCQRCLEWEQALNAILAGKRIAKDSQERIELACIAALPAKQLSATAVRFYTEAFQAEPSLADDVPSGYRFNAACAAVRASTQLCQNLNRLDDTGSAEMRYKALSWLQDDLSAHARVVTRGRQGATGQSMGTLLYWQQGPDLAAVRGAAALAKLPEAEQVAWLNLWAQVDSLLAKATPRK
jgi:serine/threonine protein kinase/Flp pilus assembly protein TadD